MKEYTTEEIFCAMPNLRRYFKALERESVRAELGLHRKGKSKEEVERKRNALLNVVKTLTSAELQLLYYLRETDADINALMINVRKKRPK